MVVIQYQSVNNKQIKISIKRNAIKLIWTVSYLFWSMITIEDLSATKTLSIYNVYLRCDHQWRPLLWQKHSQLSIFTWVKCHFLYDSCSSVHSCVFYGKHDSYHCIFNKKIYFKFNTNYFTEFYKIKCGIIVVKLLPSISSLSIWIDKSFSFFSSFNK